MDALDSPDDLADVRSLSFPIIAKRLLQHEHLQSHESGNGIEFRHIPMMALTILAVLFVIGMKVYHCVRPPAPFEARDGDTVAPDEDEEDFDNDELV